MSTDLLKDVWKSHEAETRVHVDAEQLRRQVMQSNAELRSIILGRDAGEFGTALVMIPLWVVMGQILPLPWTWYLGIAASVWVAGFLAFDRRRFPQRGLDPGDSLIKSARESLSQVEHQIWLLRNVFWWYLLPFSLALTVFFLHVGWITGGWMGASVSLGCTACVAIVYWRIYVMNQVAVRDDLGPRRHQLLTTLSSLGDDQAVETLELDRGRPAQPAPSRRLLILGGLLTLGVCFALAPLLSPVPFDKPAVSDGPGGADLARLITELRTDKKLVALAAMVTVEGQTVARAAVGERMVDRGVAVGLEDQWHLGSITKSFTATMIARLIDAGTLKWTDTVGDRLPDAAMHELWKGVTLEQLLTHTAGAPANFGVTVRMQRPEIGPELTQARREAVRKVLASKPESTPGTKFVYSNVGFTLAAVMAEQTSGSSWEELVQREVFQPLKLNTAGFGPPKSPLETLDQPRGHHRLLGKKTGVADTVDNTPIMGPSGAIHLSLDDLTAYAWEHLQGEKGAGQLLSAETFRKLHSPRRNDYACGWVRKAPTEAIPHTVYWHNGSNTMWYALVAFIPETNMVVAVASNDGDIKAAEFAAWKVVEAAVKGGP